ncbi:MAG TPA: hypothetical protein VFM28_07305 [Nitrososphaeraceae archaeon]|jgi:hypothetical protein|nr:hypothetical protein [Nitrososphaeraceae archaeon]
MSNLFLLIGVIWCTLLAISAFLVIFIAPIDIVIFNNRLDLYITSILQATIAITIVLMLIAFLNYLKRLYIQKKLNI